MSADQRTGRVAVITGASSGIGEATARALGAEGHRVALLARRAERSGRASTPPMVATWLAGARRSARGGVILGTNRRLDRRQRPRSPSRRG